MRTGSATGVTETAVAAGRVVEVRRGMPRDPATGRDDELGDPVTPTDNKRGIAEVHDDDGNLTTIIGVNGAWTVGQDDTVSQGEPTSGPDLGFESRWKGHANAGGNQDAPPRRHFNRGGDGGPQIHAGGVFRGIFRQRDILIARQPMDGNFKGTGRVSGGRIDHDTYPGVEAKTNVKRRVKGYSGRIRRARENGIVMIRSRVVDVEI